MLAGWGAGLFTAECVRDGAVDGPAVEGPLSWGGLEAARSADSMVVGAGSGGGGGTESSRSDAIGGTPFSLPEGAVGGTSCCGGRPETGPSNGGAPGLGGGFDAGGAPVVPLFNACMAACKSAGHTDPRAC